MVEIRRKTNVIDRSNTEREIKLMYGERKVCERMQRRRSDELDI